MLDTVPAAPADDVVELTEPRDGVPDPLDNPAALPAAARTLRAGIGAVAVDAERASGYRYGQRAYLVQVRRPGAGTFLIDPLGCPDLTEIDAALADAEWVLHAASQDLGCLAALNLRPRRLFDTELAGRLAGFERVGLGAMVERVLGLRLEKGHSAADWSTRPLPEPWLRYAALDVEVLVELRDALESELADQGKLAWAREEFAALVTAGPPPVRAEPWRRTSGIARARTRRQLAAVRELWGARDELARRRDIAPGRVLPDAALVQAALIAPSTAAALLALPVFGGRSTRRHADRWMRALDRARGMAVEALPPLVPAWDGPPPGNRWADRDAAAAARLSAVRTALAQLADSLHLPTENLVSPDAIRRLAWTPPADPSPESVAVRLRDRGVREWQVGLTAALLSAALAAAAAPGGDVVTGQ